jgi:hypothetical protein
LERRRWQTPLGGSLTLRRWPVERKHVLGGLVFGTGWAVTGAGPGTVAAMIGTGSLLGLVLLSGLSAGIAPRDTMVVTLPAPGQRAGEGRSHGAILTRMRLRQSHGPPRRRSRGPSVSPAPQFG